MRFAHALTVPRWCNSKGARDVALHGEPLPAVCSAVPHDHDPMHDAQNMAMKAAFLNHVLAAAVAAPPPDKKHKV